MLLLSDQQTQTQTKAANLHTEEAETNKCSMSLLILIKIRLQLVFFGPLSLLYCSILQALAELIKTCWFSVKDANWT